MDIRYVAKNYKISDKFKELIEKKLSKLERYFSSNIEVKVNCTEQNDRYKLELTINCKGLYLRSEVESDNMYNNIDLALPKLEKQIVKSTKRYKNKFAKDVSLEIVEDDDAEFETKQKIVKTKVFDLDPITTEDAIAYMDAVGHNFYVFLNAENGEINVLYRRNDGNLGLIDIRK